MRAVANVALGAVLLLWVLLLAAWLLLHWVILPHIDEWRPAIERQASEAVGAPIRIGEIRVQSGGWLPAMELRDLRILDREGREALRLERVQTALAPHALLSLQLRFAQVLVDGAQLDVRRDAAGRLRVAGFDWEAGSAERGARIRDWVFAQREFVFRDSQVVWTDETRDVLPLRFEDVDLVLRNGVRRHDLRVDATPPQAWGDRFSVVGRFAQPLLAQAGDLMRWSGELYANVPRADVAELRRYVALPFDLDEGDGALRAWVELQAGQARTLTVDLALRLVSLRLAASLQRLDLEQIQGRLVAARDAAGVRLQARQLQFVTGDGLRWPAGELRLSWRQTQDLQHLPPSPAPVTGGEFSADRLDLDLMARTAERLPVGNGLRQALASLAPQGIVETLEGRWDGEPSEPEHYRVKAQVSGLSLAAAIPPAGVSPSPVRPGLRGGRLRVEADERGGVATVAVKRGALIFPGVWDEAELPLDELDAELGWRIVRRGAGRPPAVELQVRQARFANADAAGDFYATWRTGDGEGIGSGGRYPGRLELDGRLQRADASRVARYMPLAIAASARDYVRRALVAGKVHGASVRVVGDLWDFPFDAGRSGEFHIKGQAQDVEYVAVPGPPAGDGHEAEMPPWPAFSRAAGEFEFDRAAMHLRGVRAAVWGYELRDIHATIADLAAHEPVLDFEGRGKGPAADLLRYLRVTPLAQWVGPALESSSATGSSDLTLALQLPLAHPAKATVRGSLQLAGNDLRLRADLPPLLGARGRIDFTQRDLSLHGTTARLLGGDTSFEGGLAADGNLRLSAQGMVTADALRAAPGLGSVSRLAQWLRGQASWRGSLALVQGIPELTLASNLAGLQIDLPAPLAKPAAATWPMRLQTARQPGATPGAPPRDSVQFDLGEVLKLRLQREWGADGPRVQRGSVAVQDGLPPEPAAGVVANLNLGRFDVDAWQQVLDRLQDDVPPAWGADLLPQQMRVRAEELRSGRRRLSNLNAEVRHSGSGDDTVWRAELRADQLDGQIEVRPPAGPTAAGRVMARLTRLALPPADVAGVEDLLRQPPPSVPALDIVVDDFELRGHKLGRLQVQAVNRRLPGRAGAREWQLEKLSLVTPEAQLSASGRWLAGGRGLMQLDFGLALDDSGAFAERLGAGQVLRGGKGRVQGKLSWAGSPLDIDYPSLEGQLDIALDAGQFLRAEPGGARLLGLLSLQALPRRLTLDFSDLFQQGFAFDSVAGSVTIAGGIATTNELRMRGPQATVLMQGSADLQRETQDLQVLVVPNIDTTAPALAGFVLGPAVGFGTLLAQWALREPLVLANTREFRVTGSWGEPNVQPVARGASSPAPAPAPSEAAPPPVPAADNRRSG